MTEHGHNSQQVPKRIPVLGIDLDRGKMWTWLALGRHGDEYGVPVLTVLPGFYREESIRILQCV